jgi:hypothetical protein
MNRLKNIKHYPAYIGYNHHGEHEPKTKKKKHGVITTDLKEARDI